MSDLKREISQTVGTMETRNLAIARSSSYESFKQKIITKPVITKV